jgi:small subunit ribosomal protein S6
MAKKITKTFETIFILDAVIEDEKLDPIINRYTEFLTKNGSSIVKVDRWGRKKFAYPIKRKFTGNYVSIEFTSSPGIVAKLDRAYHLDDNILRFLTISYDKRTLADRDAYFEKKQHELAEKEREASLEEEPAQTGELQGSLENPKEETEPNS